MTPILDIQQQLREEGRIRIGEQIATGKGGTRPAKLDALRFTSPDRVRIDRLAALYGGTVKQWDAGDGVVQWEVKTEAREVRIIVPPYNYLDQWYELWTGGGCQRRCDGQTTVVADGARKVGPCLCPEDRDERSELSKNGKACKATTRLWVMLPDLEGFGTWRLESHGFYAAAELGGMAQLLATASEANAMLPGRLALEERTHKSVADGTRRYAVPVIHVDVSAEALAAGRNSYAQLPAPERPETHGVAPADTVAPPKAVQAPVSTHGTPETAKVSSRETREPTKGDTVRFLVMCRDVGYGDEDRHRIMAQATGGRTESTKDATVAEFARAEALLSSEVRAAVVNTIRAFAGQGSDTPPGATEAEPEGSVELSAKRIRWALELAPMATTNTDPRTWEWKDWAFVFKGVLGWVESRKAVEDAEAEGQDIAEQGVIW